MKKIKVTQYFMGKLTNEQIIQKGIYDIGDPCLFGLEDYLVNDQQKAEYIEVDNPPEPDPTEADTQPASEPPPEEVDELEHKGRKLRIPKAKKTE
jgi:hypothetical protein